MKYFIAREIVVLLVIVLGAQSPLISQPVHILGSIGSRDLNPIKIDQLGINAGGEQNKEYDLYVQNDGTFSIEIKNMDEGMYRIRDAYIGHKIFISPGDVVEIQLKKIGKPSYEIFHKMNVKTRYPMNYNFFDSILPFFGHKKLEFSKANFDGKSYKEACLEMYKKSTNLLRYFYEKKQVSDRFLKYAQIELETNYLRWLLFPFAKYKLDPKSVDRGYFKELDTFSFDNTDAIHKTQDYLLAAAEYNNFVLNPSDEMDKDTWLYASFRTAASHFTGFARDQLMAWKIDEIIRSNSPDSNGIKEVLSSFFQICKTPFLRNEIAVKTSQLAQKLRNAPALFEKLMDKPFFIDLKGNAFSMSTFPLKQDWLVIDCWASWCVPCKEQDPSFEKFRQQYRDRIDFVNVSLDKDKLAWEEDIQKYNKNSDGNYLLRDGDENAFTYFFDISSIPRFILIDRKNKKVINDNMPFPSNEEEFEKAIRQVLN